MKHTDPSRTIVVVNVFSAMSTVTTSHFPLTELDGVCPGELAKVKARMSTARADARILIVDDEEDTAVLLTNVLRKRGFSADAVFSGAECLAYLRRDPVDVVISDIQMPGMSGIELCEQLYRRYPDIAPIVLTGY